MNAFLQPGPLSKATRAEFAAMRAHALKRGTWSKSHKRLGRLLNRALDGRRRLLEAGVITGAESTRVFYRLIRVANAVGMSITNRGDDLRVFIPGVRRAAR
jgi:hypothetical protein